MADVISELEKCRILISCSDKTLVLAEKLRDELRTAFCEAALWSDDGKGQTSPALLAMLEDEAEQFDFAAVILVKDDVTVTQTDTLTARDTYAFQAGLFMATIGRNRCFLINSVEQGNLPSHLGGIVPIPFEEPSDLSALDACAKAAASVATALKEHIGRRGISPYRVRVPTLSVKQLWQRERHQSEGGDLLQGEVIVCDTQPLPQEKLAIQLRTNIDHGIRYTYFLLFTVDTVEKICQALQVILIQGVTGPDHLTNFIGRMNIIKEEGHRVVDDLRNICRDRSLRIILLPQEPQFSFRIHNASNRELATVYARYGEQRFIRWARGPSAETLWSTLPKFVEDDDDRLFASLSLEMSNLDNHQKKLFESSLDRALGRYFPGFQHEIKQLCTGA